MNKQKPAIIFSPLFFFFLSSVCIIELVACGPKQAPYFQGSFDTTRYTHIQFQEPLIQKHDLLSINVFSDDPAASAVFNQPVVNNLNSGSASSNANAGYLVNDQGDILFHGLGRLHVEGLTKSGLIQLLNEKLKDQLKNPYYAIRLLNYKITVQGEVNRAGTFNIPDERVTILEAIALAGDMNVYAKRDNILLIREQNGKRELARVDITKPDLFNSQYYYLQQNDMIIVEPTKKKPSAGEQQAQRNISIISLMASTIAIVYSVLRR